MYEIAIVQDFIASHALTLYDGSMETPHEHSWKVEVYLQGEHLDQIEVLIDFLEVKNKLRELLERLSRTYLNENLALKGRNPSAEVVALGLFQELKKQITHPVARLAKVTVWEEAGCAASYFE